MTNLILFSRSQNAFKFTKQFKYCTIEYNYLIIIYIFNSDLSKHDHIPIMLILVWNGGCENILSTI